MDLLDLPVKDTSSNSMDLPDLPVVDTSSKDSPSMYLPVVDTSSKESPSMDLLVVDTSSTDSPSMELPVEDTSSTDSPTVPQTMASRSDAEKESLDNIAEVIETYDDVLLGNLELDQKYQAREVAFKKILIEVQARLREIRQERLASAKKKLEKPVFQHNNVGKPYFKDKDLNLPPDNEDTILMKKFHMYDFSKVTSLSGWTIGDRNGLLTVLLDLSKEKAKQKILSKLTQMQKIKVKTPDITCKIAQLKRELVQLKHKTLENLGVQAEKEFDWEEVASKLNKRHSAREYKAFWELFFHPRVNKSPWSHEEHQALEQLAVEKNMQDWESIAKALNTGRTAYQCYVYFRTNTTHPACGRKWTQEEINHLQRVIDFYKEDNYIPWGKVAESIKNRTKIQCYNKYMSMMEGRKGRFIPEEDSVILNFVEAYGTDFRKMSSFLKGRSALQLRARFGRLMKLRVSTTWSVEDDKKLLQIIANQDSQANYSNATKHFPGKDRQNIRSRYNTLMRWINKNPRSDISLAPRRPARRLLHGEPKSNLVKAIEIFRKKINTDLKEMNEVKSNKLSRESSETVIDDSIMSTISAIEMKKQQFRSKTQRAKAKNSFKILQVQDISTTPQRQSNLVNLKHILILLNAKLEDKKKFYSSEVGKGFEAIENQILKVHDSNTMKSYSRKEGTSEELFSTLPLFDAITDRRKFLLPPNFATVTGSRVILNHLATPCTEERSNINVKQLARNNLLVQKYLKELQERFNNLFTWPYILSNKPPSDNHTRRPK